MRDIRSDITERLRAAEEERAQLTSRLREVDSYVSVLMKMLELEEARSPRQEEGRDEQIPPLADFIIAQVNEEPRTKEYLKEVADLFGYISRGESPGRVVHLTLVNLARSNRIKELPDGRFAGPQYEVAPGTNAGGVFG